MASKRTLTRLRKAYEPIYKSLGRVELQRGKKALEEFDASELFEEPNDLWLGFYTAEGIELALERYGVLDDIRARGFKKLDLELQMDDPDEHMVRIWSELPRCDEPLLELVASRGMLHFGEELADEFEASFVPVVTLHWALMQNPLATFDGKRLPLPGQSHPGLGIAPQIMALLANVARRLNATGLMTVPAHFSNAEMYSATFRYVSPGVEGRFRALERDSFEALGDSLPRVSWAVNWGLVTDGRVDDDFEWFHEAMIWPIGEPFRSYFDSKRYKDAVDQAASEHRFTVDKEAVQAWMARRGLTPWDKARVDTWLADQALT
ncbi:MAG: hypothetical protein ACOCV2_01825 [Persicimonas sp.]